MRFSTLPQATRFCTSCAKLKLCLMSCFLFCRCGFWFAVVFSVLLLCFLICTSEPIIYHYIDERKTWQDAQSYCREHHSDLATISNMEDNNIALKSKTNGNYVWIGLNNNNPQGAWRWSDSSDASFYNWKKGEPNGDGKSLHNYCVEMKQDGLWNDKSCNTKRPFICHGEL